MSQFSRILPSVMLALLIPQPALAAADPKSDVSTSETRRILHAYGTCVINRQEARAAQAIVGNVSNGELIRKYGSLIDGTCLPPKIGTVVKVRFQGDQYRYSLADALVRKQLAALPAPVLDAVPRLDHRDPGQPPVRVTPTGKRFKEKQYQAALRAYDQDRAYSYLSRYGECVVRVNPAAARDLLLTDPVTVQEAGRFAAMKVALGTCLPEDESLALGKLALRGTIAVNYYRLAYAAGIARATR
jgi:hypothetical protein